MLILADTFEMTLEYGLRMFEADFDRRRLFFVRRDSCGICSSVATGRVGAPNLRIKIKKMLTQKLSYGRRKGGIFGILENFDCAVISILERFVSARLIVDPNAVRFVGVVP